MVPGHRHEVSLSLVEERHSRGRVSKPRGGVEGSPAVLAAEVWHGRVSEEICHNLPRERNTKEKKAETVRERKGERDREIERDTERQTDREREGHKEVLYNKRKGETNGAREREREREEPRNTK